jgi:hypothetical protein
VVRQGALTSQSCACGISRILEGGIHGISDRFEDDPGVGLHRGRQQLVVTCQGWAGFVGVRLKQARAALYVAEEERDRASGYGRHRRMTRPPVVPEAYSGFGVNGESR